MSSLGWGALGVPRRLGCGPSGYRLGTCAWSLLFSRAEWGPPSWRGWRASRYPTAFLMGVCPDTAGPSAGALQPVPAAGSCGGGRPVPSLPVAGAGRRAVLRELSCSGVGRGALAGEATPSLLGRGGTGVGRAAPSPGALSSDSWLGLVTSEAPWGSEQSACVSPPAGQAAASWEWVCVPLGLLWTHPQKGALGLVINKKASGSPPLWHWPCAGAPEPPFPPSGYGLRGVEALFLGTLCLPVQSPACQHHGPLRVRAAPLAAWVPLPVGVWPGSSTPEAGPRGPGSDAAALSGAEVASPTQTHC